MIEAQAEYLAYLGRVGEAREVDGAFAVRTGAQSNTENGVVAHGAVGDVPELVAWFADAPACWLDVGGRNHDALVAAGAQPEQNGWEITFDAHAVALAPRPGIDVRRVQELDDWFALAGDDYATLRPVYERLAVLPDETVRFFVVEGEGFAAAFYGDVATLFLHVGVAERARRRGIATALVAARLAEAGRRIVLAPSPDGVSLYESFGVEVRRLPLNRWYYIPC